MRECDDGMDEAMDGESAGWKVTRGGEQGWHVAVAAALNLNFAGGSSCRSPKRSLSGLQFQEWSPQLRHAANRPFPLSSEWLLAQLLLKHASLVWRGGSGETRYLLCLLVLLLVDHVHRRDSNNAGSSSSSIRSQRLCKQTRSYLPARYHPL